MKKLIISFFVVILIFTAYQQKQLSNDIEETISQPEAINSESKSDTEKRFLVVDYNCLPKDESKSEIYNDTISAYNDFLAQKAKENLVLMYSDDYAPENLLPYVYLKDLNDDSIPEIIVKEADMYPYRVYTYRNGEILELAGPMSNGWHGPVQLLENGMYGSKDLSTGWTNSFVTYNNDGTQTVECFSSNDVDHYVYIRYTVSSETERWNNNTENYYSIRFESTKEGKQKFYEMYASYEEALKYPMNLGESYSPYVME